MVRIVEEEQYCLYCDELRQCSVRYSEDKNREDMFTCLTCGTIKIGMFNWLPPNDLPCRPDGGRDGSGMLM